MTGDLAAVVTTVTHSKNVLAYGFSSKEGRVFLCGGCTFSMCQRGFPAVFPPTIKYMYHGSHRLIIQSVSLTKSTDGHLDLCSLWSENKYTSCMCDILIIILNNNNELRTILKQQWKHSLCPFILLIPRDQQASSLWSSAYCTDGVKMH